MATQKALQNISIVVAATRMTQQEHDQLKQDLVLVAQRCQLADELEKEKEDDQKSKKEVE